MRSCLLYTSINTLSGEITELERDMDALDEQFVRYRTMEKDAKSLAKDHLLTAEDVYKRQFQES